MSRTAVRLQIAQYLGGQLEPGQNYKWVNGPITNLETLYSSWVRVPYDEDFLPGTGNISGAVGVIHLPDSHEVRQAYGGGGHDGIPSTGWKRVDYTCALEIYFLSRQDRSEQAMADFDTMVDSLTSVIRADHTFGAGGNAGPGKIWQAGEGPKGVDILHDAPDVSDARFRLHAVARFEVTEWISS